jgi:Helix-turn-helix domain
MSALSLDQYVVDVLMPDLVGHDKSPSAFLVYLYLWRVAGARGRAQVSYTTMAGDTGLSKASVQRAVAILKRRKLLAVSKANPTAVPDYRVVRPWLGRMPG